MKDLSTDTLEAREDTKLSPADPFDGFFAPGWTFGPGPGSLLDFPRARRWFERVSWGVHNDLYTYQQATLRRHGPRVLLEGRPMLQMSAYDYLGLLGHRGIEKAARAAIVRDGTGSGGVRLLSGTREPHRRLERELAAFKGTEAALTFSSGYLACLGVISALFSKSDLVLADEYAHRSLLDGCRLAGVDLQLFPHNDLDALERALANRAPGRRALIVVDGLYSMDGDLCPLPALVAIKRRQGAFLLVDEAHSFAILGSRGRGVDEHYGMHPEDVDIWLGSLSKAVPSNGGFVAGSRDLIIYLQHGAGSFMFSSALCPSAVAAARAALRRIPGSVMRRQRLHERAAQLRTGLSMLGFDIGLSRSPIVPVMTGSDESAYRLARVLHARGVLTSAVVPPAVPRGRARLRLCATAAHTPEDIDEALAAFREARREIPPSAVER